MDKDEKQCSASTTDVEAASQKSKRESDDDDSVIVILKKQRKAIDEINHSLKEISGFIKSLQENSLRMSDLEDILLKAKETPNKKVEPMYECCFGPKGIPKENRWDTVFVKGLDCSLSRDDIKSTLKKHFGSCGEVTRVFVPIECKTPLGFAFLDLKEDAEKALTLNGKVLGGLKLEVAMAREREENSFYPNFKGCKICSMASHQGTYRRFYEHHTGLKYTDSVLEGCNGEKGIMMRRIVNDGYWPWEEYSQ